MSICVIIPTYNNAGTILTVVREVLGYVKRVFVVCDGPVDGTLEKVTEFAASQEAGGAVSVISHFPNRGKGTALVKGFEAACSEGFRYALTVDSDGQHPAREIPVFIDAVSEHPDSLIIGSRRMDDENMPDGNRFANRFSNFWFRLQTLRPLPDTQSGFRVYPLAHISQMHLFTARYETELEILVRSAWRGISLVPIYVNILYPPVEKRVSHFRKGKDFFRISLLNMVLTCMAFLYGYPSMLIHKLHFHA